MANNDRKRRILAHIAQSADGLKFLTANFNPPSPEPAILPPPLVEATPIAPPSLPKTKVSNEERKRRILNHASQSSGNFGVFSLQTPESEKKRVLEHIQKSLDL